jgi:hypothetical protein
MFLPRGRKRVGLWLYTASSLPAAKSVLVEFQQADGTHICWVGVSATTNKLGFYVGDHSAACAATASATFTTGQWYHIGIDLKVDSSTGWCSVYQDGVALITFTGNTGNANIGRVILHYCGAGAGQYWANGWVDDYVIEDTTGQGGPDSVPDRRIYTLYPNGAGTYAEGKAKGGGASSYTNVDDGYRSDVDSTYNYADALDQRETYALTTFTVPAGATIAAVQAKVHALKSDAGKATQIAILTRGGSSLTDNEDAAQNLAGDWLLYSGDIEVLDPHGDAWASAQIDSLQAGFRGKGTF